MFGLSICRPTAPAAPPAPSPQPRAVVGLDGVKTHRSCGWFDSSWELQQGLRVVVHDTLECLPPEVPLEWLLQ